jgi:hypothetical protein
LNYELLVKTAELQKLGGSFLRYLFSELKILLTGVKMVETGRRIVKNFVPTGFPKNLSRFAKEKYHKKNLNNH